VSPRRGRPNPGDFVFPSYRHNAGCFDPGAALDLLRELRPGSATVHGFRSAFFDWAMETTDYSDRLVNAALAHVVKDRVERAYHRSTLVERRRLLMEAWNAHCLTPVAAANTDTPELAAEAA
jgi:integrase